MRECLYVTKRAKRTAAKLVSCDEYQITIMFPVLLICLPILVKDLSKFYFIFTLYNTICSYKYNALLIIITDVHAR